MPNVQTSWIETCDLTQALELVESGLNQVCGVGNPQVPNVCAHLCGAGGKRLRPALVFLAARAGNAEAPPPVQLAVAVEVLHTATLLHDDVVDEAATRRHRPSANREWGNGMATFAGAYLFARAMHAFASSGEVVNTFAADAIEQVWRGQAEEARNAHNLDIDEATYFDIIKGKTAAMYAFACRLGALSADAPGERIERLATYGSHLGLGFQLVDDVLDMTADEMSLGKPTALDIRAGVYTLPVIYTLRQADAGARRLRAILSQGHVPPQDLEEAVEILRTNGSIQEAVSVATLTLQHAMQQLDGLPETEARDGLLLIAAEILERARVADGAVDVLVGHTT